MEIMIFYSYFLFLSAHRGDKPDLGAEEAPKIVEI